MNKTFESTYKTHKRQQASVGLGIVTRLLDDDDDFFAPTKCCRSLTSSVIPSSSVTNGFDVSSPRREKKMILPFPEDGIIPLPSPAQIITTPSTGAIKYPLPIMGRIPVISHSLASIKTNMIPSLSEQPMLGDVDDPSYQHSVNSSSSSLSTASSSIVREYNFPSPSSSSSNPCEDENTIIGKNIWKYQIRKLLGVGAFSKVFLAENINNRSNQVAVKMINKKRMATDPRIRSSIEREVGVLKLIHHNGIVQMEATMETEHHLCIVLEYVKGGELFDFVQRMHGHLHASDKDIVDEQMIKRLLLELIQIVDWLHHHNIVHRDLKLENILVYFDNNGDPHLKVTDFGLARVINPESPILSTRCGSEEYAAPEIVQGLGYDGRSTDTWSIGIILYALLVGYLPFSYSAEKGERLSHLFHRILRAQVKWPSDKISLESKEVVACLLKRHPEKRIKLNDITSLPWFNL